MPEILPEEMKGLQSIIDLAKDFDIVVYRELKRSQALVEQKFYTEAALRLGKAVEASIYSTARQLRIRVSIAGLERLDNISDEIEVAQVTIAQNQSKEGIKKLLKCIKDLASTVDTLITSNPAKQSDSQSRERPLRNRQLFKAFKEQIGKSPENIGSDKNAIISRLKVEESQLEGISSIRNRAAHASLNGDEREVDREEYINLVEKVNTFINALFEVRWMFQSLDK